MIVPLFAGTNMTQRSTSLKVMRLAYQYPLPRPWPWYEHVGSDLPKAVRVFHQWTRGGDVTLTVDQLSEIAAYLVYYFKAPCWEDGLQRLSAAAAAIHTPADLIVFLDDPNVQAVDPLCVQATDQDAA